MERKMIRNLILYIFIYVILTGCENNITGSCESNCYLNITAPGLEMNEDGVYLGNLPSQGMGLSDIYNRASSGEIIYGR